jgi:hypothetical protein
VVQIADWQLVICFEHCKSVLQPTHAPCPLQNMPVPHAVSTAASVTPQVPLMQVRVWQAVSWPRHSEAVLQPTHAP